MFDLAVLVSAVLTVVGSMLDDRTLLYVFKPLTTALILASVMPARGRYRVAVAVGLLFSLIGDVSLMLPSEQLLAGLAAFLIAHIAYLIAFTSDTRFAERLAPFVVWGVVGAALLTVLWPGIPEAMRLPVVGYVVAILAMAGQAGARFLARRVGAAAVIGAAFFVASDALIAFDRFRGPVPFAQLLILATYYAAQFLIARSIL